MKKSDYWRHSADTEVLLVILLMILKGISPSICQHTINLEPDAKPVVDHQRWLNPKMKDMIRTEVLKLLAAGIIYPIADSKWVSPVHCVPKKEV